jgi:hypothetical protein
VALALGPWSPFFGFAKPSLPLMVVIGTITLIYLASAEAAKRLALPADVLASNDRRT